MKLSMLNEYMLPVRGLPLKSQPGTVLPEPKKDLEADDAQNLAPVEPENPIKQVKDAVSQDSSNVLGIKRF